jgi:Mn-dependent DtxR family transcriptional regulator
MLRPNFAEYLRKIDDLNGGELRIINQYEVGECLGLSSKQTDEIVDQLRDARMIKKITRNKIVLSPQALYAIHKTEKSE